MLKSQKAVFYILAFLFLSNVLALIIAFEQNRFKNLEVDFFNVGQGDSILINVSGSGQILIDGGPSSLILEKLGKKMPFWDRTIELFILTHPEKDHLTGLIEVLKRYQVQNILWTGVVRDTSEFKEWEKVIAEEGANIYCARFGQKVFFSKRAENYLEVLYPLQDLKGVQKEDSNNTSIVSRLVFGQKSFLFTGDISQEIESELLRLESVDLKADILKVAHHGSKFSSSADFISKVLPSIAVIQVGQNNSYGHPAPEVLQTLEGVNIFRTDESGDISCFSDEQEVFCQSFK